MTIRDHAGHGPGVSVSRHHPRHLDAAAFDAVGGQPHALQDEPAFAPVDEPGPAAPSPLPAEAIPPPAPPPQ